MIWAMYVNLGINTLLIKYIHWPAGTNFLRTVSQSSLL
jgi:hypothetical protein